VITFTEPALIEGKKGRCSRPIFEEGFKGGLGEVGRGALLVPSHPLENLNLGFPKRVCRRGKGTCAADAPIDD